MVAVTPHVRVLPTCHSTGFSMEPALLEAAIKEDLAAGEPRIFPVPLEKHFTKNRYHCLTWHATCSTQLFLSRASPRIGWLLLLWIGRGPRCVAGVIDVHTEGCQVPEQGGAWEAVAQH